MKITRILILLFSLFTATSALGAVTPLAISVFPPVAFPGNDFTTTGVRLSLLWGDIKDVYGFDIGGIGNITDHGFGGIGISGVFNITKGATKGTQIAGLFNYNEQKTDITGLQIAGLLNRNAAASSVLGLEVAAINYVPFTSVTGFQIGVINKSLNVNGFQIGLINMTQNLHGIQIGLLNFYDKGLFVVSPVINIGFN
jgi:hypothetical protein